MKASSLRAKHKEGPIAAIALAVLVSYGSIALWPGASPAAFAAARIALLATTIVGALPFAVGMIRSFLRGHFGVDVIAIAAIASSIATGQTLAGGVILLMLSGGGALERYAEGRARASLERLMRQAPTVAHRLERRGSEEIVEDVPVSSLKTGDLVLVKRDEIVPIDGIVEDGASAMDESAITGEPIPRDVGRGDKAWSGARNGTSIVSIRASGTFDQSVFSGIVRLVREAEQVKAPTVRMADRYSVAFTVFTFAVAGAAWIINPELATAVLVVATPCPLILAAPIAFIAGMSRAAREGVIVKHGGVFEAVDRAQAFFFDKTGTLTFGIPSVKSVTPLAPGHSARDILRMAASIEEASNHVLARSVVEKAEEEGVPVSLPSSVEESAGGVSGMVDGKKIAVGNASFIGLPSSADARSFVAENGLVIGSIEFTDRPRSDGRSLIAAVGRLSRRGSDGKEKPVETVLVTGDALPRAREIAAELGISSVKAECLPAEKVALIKDYERRGLPVAMVGDGVNDAPALASASVGIALGSHGATAATDTADAVIAVDDIGKVASLIETSERTVRIAKESIFVGIALSIGTMAFAFAGMLPPVAGAFLQEGIDVVVILNALRALR